jgi:hypothetical protein
MLRAKLADWAVDTYERGLNGQITGDRSSIFEDLRQKLIDRLQGDRASEAALLAIDIGRCEQGTHQALAREVTYYLDVDAVFRDSLTLLQKHFQEEPENVLRRLAEALAPGRH